MLGHYGVTGHTVVDLYEAGPGAPRHTFIWDGTDYLIERIG